MDANSFYEQRQSPEETLTEMIHYYEQCNAVNGTLITIWHNNFLGTAKIFNGWREIYQQFTALVQP
jgi:hypothetical protein